MVAIGGRLVVGTAGRERERKKLLKQGRGAGFLADFRPDFLFAQAMKCTPIYKRWKMDILSLMVPNRGLWFGWEASQPLIQSVHRELSNLQEKGCLSWPL